MKIVKVESSPSHTCHHHLVTLSFHFHVEQNEQAVENAVKLDGSEFKGRTLKVTHKRVNDPNFFAGGRGAGGPGGRGGFRGGGGGFRGRGRAPAYRGRGGGGGYRGGYRGGRGGGYHPYY